MDNHEHFTCQITKQVDTWKFLQSYNTGVGMPFGSLIYSIFTHSTQSIKTPTFKNFLHWLLHVSIFFAVCFLETKSLIWEMWSLFHYTHREREAFPLLQTAERMVGGCGCCSDFYFFWVDLSVEFAPIKKAGEEGSCYRYFLGCVWVMKG